MNDDPYNIYDNDKKLNATIVLQIIIVFLLFVQTWFLYFVTVRVAEIKHKETKELIIRENDYEIFEDPNKKYEYPSFMANGVWELTAETQKMGKHHIESADDEVILYMHKTTVRHSIYDLLLTNGMISDDMTIEEYWERPKQERHRLDLQEGDILRMRFNNIHYEIDGIKEEPENQFHLHKYVYEIHARPRPVSTEELGFTQTVTDEEEIRDENNNDIDIEADTILF